VVDEYTYDTVTFGERVVVPEAETVAEAVTEAVTEAATEAVAEAVVEVAPETVVESELVAESVDEAAVSTEEELAEGVQEVPPTDE
jgi:hypothetical protein